MPENVSRVTVEICYKPVKKISITLFNYNKLRSKVRFKTFKEMHIGQCEYNNLEVSYKEVGHIYTTNLQIMSKRTKYTEHGKINKYLKKFILKAIIYHIVKLSLKYTVKLYIQSYTGIR